MDQLLDCKARMLLAFFNDCTLHLKFGCGEICVSFSVKIIGLTFILFTLFLEFDNYERNGCLYYLICLVIGKFTYSHLPAATDDVFFLAITVDFHQEEINYIHKLLDIDSNYGELRRISEID